MIEHLHGPCERSGSIFKRTPVPYPRDTDGRSRIGCRHRDQGRGDGGHRLGAEEIL